MLTVIGLIISNGSLCAVKMDYVALTIPRQTQHSVKCFYFVVKRLQYLRVSVAAHGLYFQEFADVGSFDGDLFSKSSL